MLLKYLTQSKICLLIKACTSRNPFISTEKHQHMQHWCFSLSSWPFKLSTILFKTGTTSIICSFQLTFVSFFRDAVLGNYFKGLWNCKSPWLGFIKQFQTVTVPKTLFYVKPLHSAQHLRVKRSLYSVQKSRVIDWTLK